MYGIWNFSQIFQNLGLWISFRKLRDNMESRCKNVARVFFWAIISKASKEFFFFFFFFFVFCFLRLHPWHMEVPRLGVYLELLPPAYTRATAMPDLSHVCELYHSSQQCWMLNPRSEARDRTRNLMVPSQICFCCAMMENPSQEFLSENLGTTVLGHRVG